SDLHRHRPERCHADTRRGRLPGRPPGELPGAGARRARRDRPPRRGHHGGVAGSEGPRPGAALDRGHRGLRADRLAEGPPSPGALRPGSGRHDVNGQAPPTGIGSRSLSTRTVIRLVLVVLLTTLGLLLALWLLYRLQTIIVWGILALF